MSKMLKFNFNRNAITCIVVGGDPWFKGNEIATILGYTCPRYAIRDHIPEKFKKTMESLMLSSGRGVSPLPNHNDRIAMYINEPGLYKFIFRSKATHAEEFTDWVCSEVLPSIRKHGRYETPAAAIERIRNPTGETSCTTR